MQKQWIRLSTIQDIRIFIETVTMSDVLVDLRSQRYLVNGKSIMGVASLDKSKPLTVLIHCDDEAQCADFLAQLKPYINE